jgi:hypothetical protein
VWAPVRDVSFPLIAAIDTVAPTVEVLSHVEAAVPSGRDIVDTFLIRDNIANAGYRYRYAKGDGGGDAIDSGEVTDTHAVITKTVGRSYVNQDNGVRAVLYVSDGPHTIAANVSRQVIRDGASEVVSVSADTWRPLATASILDSSSVRHALKDLYVKGSWHYDNSVFRLFRWYAYAGNAPDSLKWVEYADSTEWMFHLDPCRLIWIKTRKNASLHLGMGKTTSLKQSYSIVAAPRTWTDFALPFGFSVRVGDVIDSTNGAGIAKGKGDSLYYYSWKVDDTQRYRCRPRFIADFNMSGSSLADKSDSLSRDDGGFTVYNPLNTPVTMSIPPIPPVLSRLAGAKAKKLMRQDGWAVCISGKTKSGTILGEVYCGYKEGSPGVEYYPIPASFSDIGITVCDNLKRPRGHGLARGALNKENGAVFPLAFVNGSDKAETITYAIENLDKLPQNVKAAVFDCITGNREEVSEPSGVNMAAKETSYRHLAIGTEAYLKKVSRQMQGWKLGLVAAFSKPFTHMLKIRFTLPFTGVVSVRFTMVDLMGRTIWDDVVACGRASGMQEYYWSGASAGRRPVVSGLYILRMTAFDDKKNIVGAFQRKISYLP